MKYTIMKYLRISSEDIDLDGLDKYESNSISHQRSLLDDFISKMPEFENSEILEAVDDGRTGTNFNRPGIQNVLDLAQRGKIHLIIVKDLSRFGRNYLEVGDYLEQLFPLWGVRFISVNDMYDSAKHNGTTGGIDIAFRNLIAEMYSRDLSDKVRSAKKSVSLSGKTCASYSFFGYDKDPNNRHKLIIDEPAAETVRLIFNLYEQGLSASDIAKTLNRDGIQTANDRQKEKGAKRSWLRSCTISMWDSSFITRILHDERYTGKHIYGKMKRIELGKVEAKSVPREEWVVVPDAFPAIISEKQFALVQEKMKKKAKPKSNKPRSEKLLFHRKISCGTCGRALVRIQSGGGYIYYCDTRTHIDDLGCMKKSIRESDVINSVLDAIRQQAQFANNIKALSHVKSDSLDLENLNSELQNLRRLTEKANGTKLLLWEKQHNGSLSPEAYQIENSKITKQIEEYADMIQNLENKIREQNTEAGQENIFVERFCKHTGIQELSRKIVDEFIKTIRVHTADRIEIILNYADEYEKIAKTAGAEH